MAAISFPARSCLSGNAPEAHPVGNGGDRYNPHQPQPGPGSARASGYRDAYRAGFAGATSPAESAAAASVSRDRSRGGGGPGAGLRAGENGREHRRSRRPKRHPPPRFRRRHNAEYRCRPGCGDRRQWGKCPSGRDKLPAGIAATGSDLQQLGINPQSISLFNRLALLLYANDPAALQQFVQQLQQGAQEVGEGNTLDERSGELRTSRKRKIPSRRKMRAHEVSRASKPEPVPLQLRIRPRPGSKYAGQ